MIGTLAVAAPFIWALMYKKPNYITLRELWDSPEYNNKQLSVLAVSRMIIGIILIGYLVSKFLSVGQTLIFLPITVVAIFLLSKYMQKFYKRIETRFVTNLNVREAAEKKKNEPIQNIRQRLRNSIDDVSAWDAHLTDLEVPKNAQYVGRTLGELNWRKEFLINVIYIKSGDNIIYSPGPDAKIMPLDHVGVFGTDEVIERFKKEFLNEKKTVHQNLNLDDIVVQKHFIDPGSQLIGITIRNSKIRENTDGIVVAIERGKERILSPSASTVLLQDDLIWIVGERQKLRRLQE